MRFRLGVIFLVCLGPSSPAFAQGWVQPYADEPTYWEYLASSRQFNVLGTPELAHIEAFAWVRPVTPIAQPVVIVASTGWLTSAEKGPERLAVTSMIVIRYSGYDAQGLSLERRDNDYGSLGEPAGHTLDDCFTAVSLRFAYAVSARRQALQQCQQAGGGVWTPKWTPWMPLRLPQPAVYAVDLPGGNRLPLRLSVRDAELVATLTR